MKDDGENTTVSEAVLRALFSSPLDTYNRLVNPKQPAPVPGEPERVAFNVGQVGADAALDEALSAIRLQRLNSGGGGATFNSIDDGLFHALDGKVDTPGATPADKASFTAYLQGLSPAEFIFQAKRLGFFFTTPGFGPDPNFFGTTLVIDEINRRISLQQITAAGTLVQPIGPITTLPVAPPPRAVAPGSGIGVAPGLIPPPVGGGGNNVAPIGPGIGNPITIGGGIEPGSGRPAAPGGGGSVPPGALHPPSNGSGGTGRPPPLGQAFPDNFFRANPADP